MHVDDEVACFVPVENVFFVQTLNLIDIERMYGIVLSG